MMKGLAIFVFFGVCGLVYCRPDDKYTTKFDNVDLDGIIKNDRLMRNYLDCVLGKRKCTKDGEELKKNLPEALNNGCEKCSDTQRDGSKRIILHLIKNKRQWWSELETKFDPQGSYRVRYADELRREGVVF